MRYAFFIPSVRVSRVNCQCLLKQRTATVRLLPPEPISSQEFDHVSGNYPNYRGHFGCNRRAMIPDSSG